MPKPQKDTPKRITEPVETSEMLTGARGTMSKACRALDSCVDRVTETLAAGEYSKDLASHLAWLTKQLAGVTGELRKLEAHEEKISKTMSPERRHSVVMAYLRSLPAHRQREVSEELERMQRTSAAHGGMLAQ